MPQNTIKTLAPATWTQLTAPDRIFAYAANGGAVFVSHA